MNSSLFSPTFGTVFSHAKEVMMKEANSSLSSVCTLVKVMYKDGTSGHGTGFMFSNKYYLLTCAHYLDNSESIHIQTKSNDLEASVAAMDENSDIAVLAFKGLEDQTHSSPFLLFAHSYGLIGSQVFLAGFRVNQQFHVTQGSISSDITEAGEVLVADCTSDNGMSGGPAVGRYYNNCFGLIRGQYGTTVISTHLIPNHAIISFFLQHTHLPRITMHPYPPS